MFCIGLDLRDSFSRSLLGENGYFIVFWHFRPNFKLILHTSKWILCKQKFWELFISILGSLQHKFYGHLDCLNRKFIGGVTFTPPRACPMNRDPGLNRVKNLSSLTRIRNGLWGFGGLGKPGRWTQISKHCDWRMHYINDLCYIHICHGVVRV